MIRLSIRVFLIVTASLLAACYTAPPNPGANRAAFKINDYNSRQPTEIAILPVSSHASTFPAGGTARLRAQLYRLLLDKGYSPLALDYVDHRVGSMIGTDASAQPLPIEALKSALDTDAFLVVDVLRSERPSRSEGGGWRVQAKITLFEARTGTTLFDQTSQGSYDVEVDGDGNIASRELEESLRKFAARLAAAIPNRV